MKKIISFFSLIICTFIWGTTFIAQDTGMDNIGPFTFNSIRFFVAFLAVIPFVYIFEKKKTDGFDIYMDKNKKNTWQKPCSPWF